MISKQQLKEIAGQTGLSLYHQEKDYLLKLFLFNYYKKFDEAIFKGGTCIKYLFGLDRFSEDLDFNTRNPKKFKKQAEKTLEQIGLAGIKTEIKRSELFKDAVTFEITAQGPLFNGTSQTINKFTIDAGYRLGTMAKPEWNTIKSEYPETPNNFLVKTLSEKEILAEKIAAMFSRAKGRDLFDAWFLLKKGVPFDKKLFKKKAAKAKARIDFEKIATRKEYENDLSKLAKRTIPYEEITGYLKQKIR